MSNTRYIYSIRATGKILYPGTPEQIARARALENANPHKYLFENYRLYFIAQGEEADRIENYVMDGIGGQPD